MSNAVLDRLREERAKHITYIDTLLSKVDEDQRDLVDAERSALDSAKQRIKQLDDQIAPLDEFEHSRAAHEETVRSVSSTSTRQGGVAAGAGQRKSLTVREQPHAYETPGHYIVDLIRSQESWTPHGAPIPADEAAAVRVRSARQAGLQTRAEGDVAPGVHQTTADTPGLLPVTIQGSILEQLDGLRPFLSEIGIKPLAGIPGKTFSRPHITQHTKVGKQKEEKAELASRDLKIDGIDFAKETVGGWLNISRQDIDWTSPSAWNIILQDLQAEYAEETDAFTSDEFAKGVTQTQVLAANDVDSWVRALYAAAAKAATKNNTVRASARRLPDTIFTSIDMWGEIGAILDIAAINKPGMRAGGANPQSFAGSVLSFPRIMVPGLPAKTVVVGRKDKFEFYEERIGLLSAVVPRVLGVEIAYGGYIASGFLDKTSFVKITPAAGAGA